MRTTILGSLGVAVLVGGCALPRTMELAEPLGYGKTAVSVETGAMMVPSGGYTQTAPTADLVVRQGLTDDVDFSFRTGSSGLGVELKRTLNTRSASAFKFAVDGRLGVFGMFPDPYPAAVVSGGAIAQWTPVSRLHLLMSPRLTALSVPRGAERLPGGYYEAAVGPNGSIGSINSNVLLVPQLNAGVGFDVTPTVRLMAEAGAFLWPGTFGQNASTGLPLSGAIGVQWIPPPRSEAE